MFSLLTPPVGITLRSGKIDFTAPTKAFPTTFPGNTFINSKPSFLALFTSDMVISPGIIKVFFSLQYSIISSSKHGDTIKSALFFIHSSTSFLDKTVPAPIHKSLYFSFNSPISFGASGTLIVISITLNPPKIAPSLISFASS
ncbi:hypothetical protein D3C76_710550 [compost metagenome]